MTSRNGNLPDRVHLISDSWKRRNGHQQPIEHRSFVTEQTGVLGVDLPWLIHRIGVIDNVAGDQDTEFHSVDTKLVLSGCSLWMWRNGRLVSIQLRTPLPICCFCFPLITRGMLSLKTSSRRLKTWPVFAIKTFIFHMQIDSLDLEAAPSTTGGFVTLRPVNCFCFPKKSCVNISIVAKRPIALQI